MFGIEKDIQDIMKVVYGPLNKDKMTNEIDISKVLIEGDTATIMGVKYKRIEEPQNLYDLIADCMVKYNSIVYPELICDILDAVEEWLPDKHYSDGEDYDLGFNDCLNKIKGKLK